MFFQSGRLGGKVIAFVILDELAEIRQSLRDFAVKVQEEVAKPLPCWERELLETPRRMKRPLPANKPFKPSAHRRGCY